MKKLKHFLPALLIGIFFIGGLLLTFFYPSSTWHAKGTNWVYDYKGTRSYPGIVTTNNKKYYVDKNHIKQNGFQSLDGKTYYFDKWLGMRTNWVQVEDNWYFFHPENGEMATGFTEINHHWYYFFEDGKLLTEEKEIDGETVQVAPSGGIVNADKLKQIKGGEHEKG